MLITSPLPLTPTFSLSDGEYSFLDNESIVYPSMDKTVNACFFTTLSDTDEDSFGPAVFPPKNKNKSEYKMFELGFVDSDVTTDDEAGDNESCVSSISGMSFGNSAHWKRKMWLVLEDLVDSVEAKNRKNALKSLTVRHDARENKDGLNKLEEEAKFVKAMLNICLSDCH